MTEKQFEQIRERARVFPFGVPSQVQTDINELIAERIRVGGDFESEADFDTATEAVATTPVVVEQEDAPRRTSGARKK